MQACLLYQAFMCICVWACKHVYLCGCALVRAVGKSGISRKLLRDPIQAGLTEPSPLY